MTFVLLQSFVHALTPLPAQIGQAEPQRVVYVGTHFFPSPFKTLSQTTEVKLPNANVESHSEEAPTSLKGDVLTYGRYDAKAPFAASPMRVHFENNSPFYAATSLEREVEVSHWGNVAVEETYVVRHTGATLKGFFSRIDYQRTQPGGSNVIVALVARLPVGSRDLYYRDEIGNISTSMVQEAEGGVELDLVPRFPLFGGWKTAFKYGYNLPLDSVVAHSGNTFKLTILFGSALDNAVVDDHTLRLILPEGAS
jgi:oligosaccharyltransferase complex subunit alpha (ribophorin I)